MKKLQHCRLHVLDRHLLVYIRLYYRAAAHPSFSRCQRLGICAILTVDNSASARYVLDEYEVISFHNDCPLKIFYRLNAVIDGGHGPNVKPGAVVWRLKNNL